MTMGDTAIMDIIRLAQNGQNLYTQGNARGALEEFKKAHELAVHTDSISVKETCIYNLATAYAANRNGKRALEYLRKLSKGYLDTLNEGELSFIHGLAEHHSGKQSKTVFFYKKALDQLNLLQSNMNVSLKKYILEQLCDFEKDNPEALIDYKQQLSGVYAYLKSPLKQLQMMCDIAYLLYEVNNTDEAYTAADDCLMVVQQFGRRTVTYKGGYDREVRETTKKFRELADSAQTSQYLVPILNEIGLLFTQLREMDRALDCFKQALHMLPLADNNVQRNEAVLFQNIGAVHNFKSVDNRQAALTALKFHEIAIDKYGRQKSYKAQGHCHVNKAYADSINKDISGAQEAYLLALTTAKAQGDIRTQWQSLEGLGAVACRYSDVGKAQKYYKEALELVHKDDKDISQTSACERILEKLLALKRGGSTVRGGLATGSGLGASTLRNTLLGSRSMEEFHSNLTKREKRELRVRRSGSLRLFPKVSYGLAPDLTPRSRDDSDDSSTSTSSSSSSSSSPSSFSAVGLVPMSSYPYSKVARPKPADVKRKVIIRKMSSKRPTSRGSSDGARRRSDRGLGTTLLDEGLSSEEEQEQAAVRKAMKQLSRNDSDGADSLDETKTPRTPRAPKVNGHRHADKKEDESDEEEDNDEDDGEKVKKEQYKRPSSSGLEHAPKTAMKREEFSLSHTKNLRFETPTVDSSDDDDDDQRQVNHREQVEADVHHEKFPHTDEGQESDSYSDGDLSHEEKEKGNIPPPVPTQSPPVSPNNTYETPAGRAMQKKSLNQDDRLRESTGHYAEIDFGNSAPESRQGETSRSDATVYETIRPPDSDRNGQVNNAAPSDTQEGGGAARSERYSRDESEGDADRGLSRAEREQQMLNYHHQLRQDEGEPHGEPPVEPEQEQENEETKKKRSKMCVIS
ncbi:uncharacterized protein [Haliotis cracherodii]|uniref:uncharacterized protein isoform X2 n=1 Tax=Haliotis cracherodii TaxID=6455 RepID=UPI0039EA0C2A